MDVPLSLPPLLRCARDVVQHQLAKALLDDRDAVALATTCHAMHHTLAAHYCRRKPFSLRTSLDLPPFHAPTRWEVGRVAYFRCADNLDWSCLETQPGQDREPMRWPWWTKSIHLGSRFHHPLDRVSLPTTLTTLSLGQNFNQSLVGVSFPATLTALYLSWCFNHPLDRVSFPAALTTLHFGSHFNQSLVGVSFPATLTTLRLGGFNQSLVGVSFPATLTTLHLGDAFNQSLVDVSLPATLTTLHLGWYFNQSLVDIAWPAALTRLHVNTGSGRVLDGISSLPARIRIL